MERVEEWVLENKDKIELGVEMIGKGCEVLAATVGQLHPLLEAIFVASKEILSNPDSNEAKYLTEQIEKVSQRLEGIQDELDTIQREQKKTSMNKMNFDYEVQMISQYEKYLEFVNAKPKFKETRKDKFMKHFQATDGDMNLDALYNSVTGESLSGESVLETILVTEEKSRRAVEEFCAVLKKLFIVGLVAVMGHAALKEGAVGESLMKKWCLRMEDVERRMKAAVDDCTENFATQAKLDVENQMRETPAKIAPEFVQPVLEFLQKKYDWVCWSVRVYNNTGKWFWNWLAGKKFQGSGGGNFFDILTKNNINVVVSYSIGPQPINKSQIQELVESQKITNNMQDLAQSIYNNFPNCVVHAISRYKDVEEYNNFQPECYYYVKHKKCYLCVHPE
ncbi:rapunzel 5 [Amia ocellicauda]|uniref:rapunzel 5 n=1 Tax=Amia ocellicauda TaxID=2972642 RepID=UPI003463DB09